MYVMINMLIVMYSGARVQRSRDCKYGNGQIFIIFLGLALMVIGYIGMLFRRMIQAAISRQREYLADAAAVQYTRNPDGLAGALRKIAGQEGGRAVKKAHRQEEGQRFVAQS